MPTPSQVVLDIMHPTSPPPLLSAWAIDVRLAAHSHQFPGFDQLTPLVALAQTVESETPGFTFWRSVTVAFSFPFPEDATLFLTRTNRQL